MEEVLYAEEWLPVSRSKAMKSPNELFVERALKSEKATHLAENGPW